MQAMIPFAFEDNLVRVVQINGEPWFAGKDVCHVLSIKDHKQALERLDDDERGRYTVPSPSAEDGRGGGEQEAIVISEAGVFRLTFTSRKPEAERFKRWLAHDVLPQLRRDGFYRLPGSDPEADEGLPVVIVNAPLRDRVDYAREYRRVFGIERARALWDWMKLMPPDEVAGRAIGPNADALECLDTILDHAPDHSGGQSVRRMLLLAIGDEDLGLRVELRRQGIDVRDDVDGFFVANVSKALFDLFAGTKWAGGAWWPVLRQLPGVKAAARDEAFRTAEGRKTRATFIPSKYLQPNLDS